MQFPAICSRTNGGSAANVAKGLANLMGAEGSAAFAGRIGIDDAGRSCLLTCIDKQLLETFVKPICILYFLRLTNALPCRDFEAELKAQNVQPLLCRAEQEETAACLCLVSCQHLLLLEP